MPSSMLPALFSLAGLVWSVATVSGYQASCRFPESTSESTVQPFFADLSTDTPASSVVVDSVVDPPNAQLQLANIRSSNLPDVDFTRKFRLVVRPNGQFLLVTKRELLLPSYPSPVNETLLYVTLLCNSKAFPLITLRLRAANKHAPRFQGEPYEMVIQKESPSGSLFPTPVLATDSEPSPVYGITYSIIHPEAAKEEFALDTSDYQPLSTISKRLKWKGQLANEQLPPVLKLRLISSPPIQTTYLLNISASDNGWPEARNSYTRLKIVVKEERHMHFKTPEYMANFTRRTDRVGKELTLDEPIEVDFSGKDASSPPIVYSLAESEHSHYFSIDPKTAKVKVEKQLPADIPSSLELEVQAYAMDEPKKIISAKLTVTDVTEVTYFTQCRYKVHLLESPSAYTRVMEFKFRGDVDGLALISGNEYFHVNDEGTLSVNPGADIDREQMEKIIVRARLKAKAPLSSKSLELCQIATVEIEIDDYNDHTPRFDQTSYTFYIEEAPFNNTEVGSLKAFDEDKGEYGRVRYRILERFDEESTPLPFAVFQADGQATIFYVIKTSDMPPRRSYAFTVEAYDSEDAGAARTSRVSIHVFLGEVGQEGREKGERSGVAAEGQGPIENVVRVEAESETVNNTLPKKESGFVEDSTLGTPLPLSATTTTTTSGPHVDSGGQQQQAHAEALTRSDNDRVTDGEGGSRRQQFDAPSVHTSGEQSLVDSEASPKIESIKAKAGMGDAPTDRHTSATKAWRQRERPHQRNGENNNQLGDPAQTHLPTSTGSASEASIPPLSILATFDSPVYNFSLIGPLAEGQYIGTVHFALSNNTAEPGRRRAQEPPYLVEYAVEEGIAGLVEIDSFSGHLTVGRKLAEGDYEELRFTVAAQTTATYGAIGDGEGGPEHKSQVLATTLVSVIIREAGSIYDVPPTFEQSIYRMEVEENRHPYRIGKVEAHHRAAELGRDHIWYILERNHTNTTAHFGIDPETGWLSSKKELDAEEKSSYNLKVSACLESNTSSCAATEIIMVVGDANDNPPEFIHPNGTPAISPLVVKIPLALPTGSQLLNVKARDTDISEKNSRIRYALRTSAELRDKLRIDPQSGVITLLAEVEDAHREGSVFGGDVDASDGGEPPLTSSISVRFQSANINAHAPEFEKFRYEVDLAANSVIPNGAPIAQVHASDPDPGNDGRVLYKLLFSEDGKIANKWAPNFTIDNKSGEITAKGELHIPQHGGDDHPSPIQLVVEAYDQSPDFVRQSRTVVLIRVRPSTGPAKHNAEKAIGEDRAETEFVPLPKTIFISEGKSVGSVILTAQLYARNATSRQLANVTDYEFRLRGGGQVPMLFAMRGNQLVVDAPPKLGSYDVELEAIKVGTNGTGATPSVHMMRVVVMKGREKYPVFEQLSYTFEVNTSKAQETFPVKLSPLNASAGDGAQVSYSLLSLADGSPSIDGLVIDSSSGQLVIANSSFFTANAEGNSDIFAVVRATNARHPSYFSDAGITIKRRPAAAMNTLSFELPLYRLVMKEGQHAGSIVNTVPLRLKEGEQVEVHFEPESHHFGILPNGSVVVKQPVFLKDLPPRASPPILSLRVVARRKSERAESRVEIAVERANEKSVQSDTRKETAAHGVDSPKAQQQQENAGELHSKQSTSSNEESTSTPALQASQPEASFAIKQFHFVVEKPEKDGLIGHIAVSGYDQHRYLLEIEPAEFRNWFRIDHRNGFLFIRQVPSELTGRQRAEFHVQLSRRTPTVMKLEEAPVSVDLILPQPSTSAATSTTTTTPAQSRRNASVADVATTRGTPARPDFIRDDVISGTEVEIPISRTTTPNSAIQSTIQSVSNKPKDFLYTEYTALLPEGKYGHRGGATVTLRPAPLRQGLPKDESISFEIENAPPALPFHVRNNSGELIAFAEIDRETTPKYEFTVKAEGKSIGVQRTRVVITILDVNDNVPRFINSPHAVALQRLTAAPGTVVARFHAEDPDQDREGQVSYNITGPPFLTIRPASGELVLSQPIPAEAGDSYELTIGAADGGRPSLRAVHKLRLEVFDEAQGDAPRFKGSYAADPVARSAGNGSYVVQVVAGVGHYVYTLDGDSTPPGTQRLFAIDPSTGIIFLGRDPLTSERNQNYSLEVSATGGRAKSHTTVHVFLEGKDQEATSGKCDFASKLYNATLTGKTKGPHRLLTLEKNVHCDEQTRYFLTQTAPDAFRLNNETGELFAVGELGRENRSHHNIMIVVGLKQGKVEKGNDSNGDTLSQLPNLTPKSSDSHIRAALVKLHEREALIIVNVLAHENGNAPKFTSLNSEGIYVFVIDWQSAAPKPIAQVRAVGGGGERGSSNSHKLNYSLTHSLANNYFTINASSGVIQLALPLTTTDEDVFRMEVSATDGIHETRVPLNIYKLQPGTTVVLVKAEAPATAVDEQVIAKELTKVLGLDVVVLAKQLFVDPDSGQTDAKRSYLLLYALDKGTKVPIEGEILKRLLDHALPELRRRSLTGPKGQPLGSAISKLSSVVLPLGSEQKLKLSMPEYVLLGISSVLLLLACCLLVILLRCCRKRQQLMKAEVAGGYMVESESAGPRPYNVELITRRAAQSLQSLSRPLPVSHEEVTMTPESRQSMITTSGIHPSELAQSDSHPVNLGNTPPSHAENGAFTCESTSSESLNIAGSTAQESTPSKVGPARTTQAAFKSAEKP